ncbi:25076_t:CDS:2, partial [Dentiscutata erythropus]
QLKEILRQAIFENDSFYSVSGRIVPTYYRENKWPKMTVVISACVTTLSKVSNSNKCPLKVSLIGVPQEMPCTVGTDENVIFNVLVNNYASQE